MTENILVGIATGLTALFVGSLAWLAYHHPVRFGPVLTGIYIINFIIVGMAFGYNQGIFAASDAIKGSWDHLQPLVISGNWLFPGLAWYAYLFFLGNFVTHWKGGDEPPARRRSKKPPPKP